MTNTSCYFDYIINTAIFLASTRLKSMAESSAPSSISKKNIKDFKFIKEIGNGSYSIVRFNLG